MLSTGEVSANDLFPGTDAPGRSWFETALLWRSQLHPGWTALTRILRAHRTWDDERRNLSVRLADDRPLPPVDTYWGGGYELANDFRATAATASLADRPEGSWVHCGYDSTRRKQDFVCGRDEDILAHAIEPLAAALASAITTFHGYWPDRCLSAAHALIALLLASAQETPPADLAAAYHTCLQIAVWGFAPYDTETAERYATLVLNSLRADRKRLPPTWIETITAQLDRTTQHNGPLVRRLAHQILNTTPPVPGS